PPQEGNMTVYILDEAHMLTTEAFNALLKVLEEPPDHVVFILATTELHKIPDTISSRCHLVQFTKASEKEIIAALEKIVSAEKITIESEALQIIATHADGSFRDAIKLLEVLSSDNSLTVKKVQASLATTQTEIFVELITAITSKNEEAVVTLFKTIRQQGAHEKHFHMQLVKLLHETLVAHHGVGTAPLDISAAATLFLLKEFAANNLSEPSIIPFLLLEVTSLEIISRAKQKKSSTKVTSKAELATHTPTITLPVTSEVRKRNNPPTEAQIELLQKIENEIPSNQAVEVSVTTNAPTGDPQKIMDHWHDFLDAVSKDNNTIGALLRSAKPLSASDSTLSIGVYYKFHQEQLSDNKFLIKIQDVVEDFSGGVINFVFELVAPPKVAELTDPGNQKSEAHDLARLATESLM
ncbi:hypothetical protein KC721_02445, partial [Candidatus Woesebacteria bacterium]|nr:hypothetical protein [Candidatus Woesebacteria bacterium]